MMTLTPRMLVAALAPTLALTGFVAPAAASASVQAPLIWDCPSYGDDPYIPPATYVPVFCAQPRVGQDTDIFLGLPTDDEIRYRTSVEGEWLVDGVSVRRGVNRYAPRAEDMGKLIQFRLHVHGTRNGQPWYLLKESVAIRIDPGEFVQAPTPTINGTADVGVPVTAVAGIWAPAPGTVLAFQWLRNGQPIDGATSAQYTPVEADRAQEVSVRVTGTRAGYRVTSRVSASQQIPAAHYTAALTPSIQTATSSPQVGVPARAITGNWIPAPESFAYQWLRNGEAIVGATSSAYTPVSADAGAQLSVQVIGSRTGYVTTDRSSEAALVSPAGPAPRPALTRFSVTSKPKISGKAKVGKKLTAKPGIWKPATVTLKYQWLRNGKAIKGATKSKYKIAKKDRGKRISVRVTGTKKGYTTVSKTSVSKRVPKAR